MVDLSSTDTAFVTFYSFKGGVGRSMALINVAGILAGRGFRVLAMDMDLEAPGISYLKGEHHGHLGFVDVLHDAVERGAEADLFTLSPLEVVERYSYDYELPESIKMVDDGFLRIMPAGRFDDGAYQTRLDRLALGKLYREGRGKPLVEAFKSVIREARHFDMVLIDSRTGFSDESGICTRDLGEHLVVVMGLNRQNVEGTADFFSALRQSEARPKGLAVVLSPVPNGEDDLVDTREAEAARRLTEAWGEPISPGLHIPYHPRLALTEEPHIFRRSRGYLYEAYSRLERTLIEMLGYDGTALAWKVIAAGKANRLDDVIRGIELLGKLGAETWFMPAVVGTRDLWLDPRNRELRQSMAKWLPRNGYALRRVADDLAEAANEEAELFYRILLGEECQDASLANNYACFLWRSRKDYDEAERWHVRAIELDREHADYLGNYAYFLHHIRRDHEQAERLFERALELEPKDANLLANYTQLLFIQRRNDEATTYLDRALAQKPTAAPLRCELHFYAYAHAASRYPDSLATLETLLEKGECSKGWHLEDNVRVAREAGHPNAALIEALARVVSGEAAVDTLHDFKEWKQGRPSP